MNINITEISTFKKYSYYFVINLILINIIFLNHYKNLNVLTLYNSYINVYLIQRYFHKLVNALTSDVGRKGID